jgi:hypothetical protein
LTRFDANRYQFLDHTRLQPGQFPDFLDEISVPYLKQDLMNSVKGRLNSRVADILSAIERRRSRGQHVNIDFVHPGDRVTPLLMAIERGSDDSVDHLLQLNATLDVSPTRPAIAAAARAGQWNILLRLLDTGRCSVHHILEALNVLNDRFENVPELVYALDNMLRHIEIQTAPFSEEVTEVQSKLIDLATRAKAPRIFDPIVNCDLLNEQSRDSEGKTLFQRLVHVPFRLRQLREICPRNFSVEKPLLRELRISLCSNDTLPACRILGSRDLPTLRPNGDSPMEPEFEQDILRSIPKEKFNPPEVVISFLEHRQLDFARGLMAPTEAHSGQRTASEAKELMGLLPWGVATGRPDVVRVLLKMGAPTDGYTVVPFDLEAQKKTPETRGGACLNAVQLAAWMGVSEVLKVLLDAELDPNSPPANLYMRSSTTQKSPRTESGGLDAIVSLLMKECRSIRGLEHYRDRAKYPDSELRERARSEHQRGPDLGSLRKQLRGRRCNLRSRIITQTLSSCC